MVSYFFHAVDEIWVGAESGTDVSRKYQTAPSLVNNFFLVLKFPYSGL